MNFFGWKIVRNDAPDRDEILYRLDSIDRRLVRIEAAAVRAERRLKQIEEDASAVRGALVEKDKTLTQHLKSHDEDAKRTLRLAKTMSEEV